ncbi:MAG TPA: TolC family protein [Terriglobia bacterium]|jgi:outer membrane protein TolC
MKLTRTFIALLLITMVAKPGMASENWVDKFLHRYDAHPDPSPVGAPAAASSPGGQLGQLLRTGELPVTMNDVVNMMLDNNLNIRADRMAPRSLYYQSLVFWQALLPSLRLTSNVSRDVALSSSQFYGAMSQITNTGLLDANVSQLLPSGTSVSVDLNMVRLLTNSSSTIFNPSYTSRATYTVGQHLLQNRGRVVNLRQVLEGQNTEKSSEAAFELQLTSLIVQAQKSYWNLVFAGDNLDLTQQSLTRAQTLLDQNRQKVEIGTLAQVDLIPTKAQVATVNDQLVQARYAVTTAEDQLKTLVSSEKDPSMFLMKLKAQDLPVRPEAAQIPTLEEAVRIALENRPELRQAQLDLKNKDIEITYTNNQRKPVIDLTASFDQNGVGGAQRRGFLLNSPAFIVPVPGGPFSSLGQLFSYGYTGFSGGISVVIPIDNKAANAAYGKALNDQRMSRNQMDSTVQAIALDVRNSLMAVEMYKARIDTAKTARELAQDTLEAEQAKFDLGTSTIQFIINDQNFLALAQTNEAQTLVNFTEALVELDRSMGMTLKKNNIEFDRTLGNVVQKTQSSTSAK